MQSYDAQAFCNPAADVEERNGENSDSIEELLAAVEKNQKIVLKTAEAKKLGSTNTIIADRLESFYRDALKIHMTVQQDPIKYANRMLYVLDALLNIAEKAVSLCTTPPRTNVKSGSSPELAFPAGSLVPPDRFVPPGPSSETAAAHSFAVNNGVSFGNASSGQAGSCISTQATLACHARSNEAPNEAASERLDSDASRALTPACGSHDKPNAVQATAVCETAMLSHHSCPISPARRKNEKISQSLSLRTLGQEPCQ